MNKGTSISELINQFKESEGESFEINEQAIIAETVEQAANKTTLAITVLSILGGFFATLSFLGFLAIAGLYDSEAAVMIFGMLFVAGSLALNKSYNKPIIDTICVSAFAIGFCMVAFAMEQMHIDENMICLALMFAAAGVLAINQSFLLSLLSFGIVFGGVGVFLSLNNTFYLSAHFYLLFLTIILTVVSLHEALLITRLRKFSKLYQPLYLSLVCCFIATAFIISVERLSYTLDVPQPNYSWLSSSAIIIGIVYTVSKIILLYPVKDNMVQKLLIYAGVVIILLPTFYAPAISGGLLIILISYLVNNKITLVAGILSFIYAISHYYYNLEYTLLTKSILLFVSGMLFLLAYVVFISKIKSDEKI
jgi:hypothetical protein